MDYSQHHSTKQTPQSEPIPGKQMVLNEAGGYSFEVSIWHRLDRFLVLGTEGGTYYASERDITKERIADVLKCLAEDGKRVVDRVVEISDSGRAPKNDPALFVLALAAASSDVSTRQYALSKLNYVARIGTHLFHFVKFLQAQRGWGRAARRAVANWYLAKSPMSLAYDITKYQQRDGWSHRDVLRVSHPKAQLVETNDVLHYVVSGKRTSDSVTEPGAYLDAVTEVRATGTSTARVIALILAHRLPREVIPTEHLSNPDVWRALLVRMPLTAMIRNLGNMTKVGALAPMSRELDVVVETLHNQEQIRSARVHPIQILLASATYTSGKGYRGAGQWEVLPQITDALDDAFYLAFANVAPTGKRILLALDISGSMDGNLIAGSHITAREGATAMALVTARVEPKYHLVAFSDTMVGVNISPRARLHDVIANARNMPFGGTDCALPMIYAMHRGLAIDAFVVYTDSETWVGSMHPVQALKMYRDRSGIPAKLVVVGMTANQFSIADPADFGMLDVVGFDSFTPAVISDFIQR